VAKELGLQVQPELVIQLEQNLSSPELGYPVVQKLLAQKKPFTALVSFNDIAAIGAIRAFRDHNLRVPEDVSIVGFDDIQGAAFHNPSLTTIRQPLRSMGTTSARILLERLREKKDYPEPVAVVPELIIRESTIPPNPKRMARHS
jgi:DNA-binding LacI/PurR family transcriptional regulator